jgi:DNA-binding response OmpR family regulator
VEDERLVLGAIQRTLRAAGYTVLSASGPEAALSLAAQRGGEIDLVVTDLVMPGMNGQELALRLIGDRPGTRILFMSGYTDDSLTQSGALDAGVDLLEKPFRSDELLRRVREALDRPAG